MSMTQKLSSVKMFALEAVVLAAVASIAPAASPGPLVPLKIDVRATEERPWQDRALEIMWRDGAVHLSGLESFLEESAGDSSEAFRNLSGTLPARIFRGAGAGAPTLLSPDVPVNGVHEELAQLKNHSLYLPGAGLEPHTDGYVYGDYMPDVLFFMCEQASPQGGHNVLIDTAAVLKSLGTWYTGDVESLSRWLKEEPVDLSEPTETGIAAGRAAEGPVVQQHQSSAGRNRLKFRRQINVQEAQRLALWKPLQGESDFPTNTSGESLVNEYGYLSLWRPRATSSKAAAAETEERLRIFDQVLQKVTALAFKQYTFPLARGEAVMVDNYRMLHGRAAYLPPSGAGAGGAPERRFWRVWSWTSEGSGLPPDGARTSHPYNAEVFGAIRKNESAASCDVAIE